MISASYNSVELSKYFGDYEEGVDCNIIRSQ